MKNEQYMKILDQPMLQLTKIDLHNVCKAGLFNWARYLTFKFSELIKSKNVLWSQYNTDLKFIYEITTKALNPNIMRL